MAYQVTLSIPIYKSAPYIQRTLLSALNQTFESIEYLLVDDKGNDESMDIVRQVIAEHPRQAQVRIIEQPQNLGTGAARNIALDQASSPYLFFMDADDVIPEDAIELLYRSMQANPCDILVGGMQWHLLTGKRVHQSFVAEWRDVAEMLEALFIHKTLLISMCAKLYDRRFLINRGIRCMDRERNRLDDIWFTTQAAAYASHIRVIPEIVYEYHAHSESVERRKYRGYYSTDDLHDDLVILQQFKNLQNALSDKRASAALNVGIHLRVYTITLLLVRSRCFDSREKQRLLSDPQLFLSAKARPLPMNYKAQGCILRCKSAWLRYQLLKVYDRVFEWALKCKGDISF